MSSFLVGHLDSFFFAVLGLPLALQDAKDYSVSRSLLVGVYALWLVPDLLLGREGRLAAAAIALLLGGLFLRMLPERLGEADVVFMSGMAATFAFWPLMLAIGLGCIGGLAVFLWLSRGGRNEALVQPLPFLPSLYWGGLTVIVGELLY